jgi:23S rRNA pseudouridine1911/1915/1917 synthase
VRFEQSVGPGEEGLRIDLFLTQRLEGVSRTAIQRALKGGLVTIDGRAVASNYKTRAGDVINGAIPAAEPLSATPEDIPVTVVYEDDDLIIVDKPSGMVVHPAKGHAKDTLVNALLFKGKSLSDTGDNVRPGIVHRLDRDTTGLIAVAKTTKAHASLSEQLKSREMGREYLAVVRGVLRPASGEIDKPIGRHKVHRKKMTVNESRSGATRSAQTLYETMEVFPTVPPASLLKVRLKTGRTHQIRVHLSAVGNPVMGDAVYGKEKSKLIDRPALHAAKLTLIHPTSGKTMVFEAPLPPDFLQLIASLRAKSRK